MISKNMIESILDEALDVLEDLGIFIENEEAKNMLLEAGAQKKSNRICINSELVKKCLNTAPKSIQIYDRSGNLAMDLSENKVHFNPGSAALNFRDSNGNIKKPDTKDYINFVKIVDFLPNFAAQSTGIVPQDISIKIADIYRLYISLINGEKPIITGTFIKENFKYMKEMLVIVRGSEENLKEKPLAIFDACTSQPLKWSDLTCQSVIDSARAGIPTELISVPLMGGTSPGNFKGSLVQHTAENLSGIVINQIAKPGAPVIYGGSPSILDMRSGTAPIGSIETMMLTTSYVAIGKYLNLPTHGYMGLSDSKMLDYQAGFETSLGIILASISGMNVVSGPGMLALEDCQSLEKLVADNELCGIAYHYLKGIRDLESKKTIKEIIKEGIEKDSFISLKSTRIWYKKEQFLTKNFIDRTNIEKWLDYKDKKSFEEKLKEEVSEILKNHVTKLLSDDMQKDLSNIIAKIKL